jgi:hypothetical protein
MRSHRRRVRTSTSSGNLGGDRSGRKPARIGRGPGISLSRRHAQITITALAALVSLACSHFDAVASQVAHGQLAGAEVIRREGALALALCRTYAAYAYLETTLKPNPDAPDPRPQRFTDWYDQATPETDSCGHKVAWSTYCATLDRTGDIYNSGVVSLGDYAAAIESLTDAKALDASGLGTMGSGVGSISTSFGAPSAVSTAAVDVGSTASSLTGPVVTYVRTHELKKLVSRSDIAVHAVLRSLDAYLAELDGLRTVVVVHRTRVLKEMIANRDRAGGFTPAASSAQAYDLAIDADYQLDRFDRHIASDRALVASIARAQDALAGAANGKGESPAKKAAADLAAMIAALGHQRPEEP